jgi:hypothetical protein
MKQKTLTVLRNAKIVGKNSMSYDDKHPENPISLCPIRDICKRTDSRALLRRLRGMGSFSRPEIAQGVTMYASHLLNQ